MVIDDLKKRFDGKKSTLLESRGHNEFKNIVSHKLNGLSEKQIVEFAWRVGLRALPYAHSANDLHIAIFINVALDPRFQTKLGSQIH